MKKTMSEHDFTVEMMGIRPGDFSYSGLQKLYEYLTGLEELCDFEIEFDAIAICCDYSEDALLNVLDNYSLDSIEELQENTDVIIVDSETVIYQCY